MTNIFELKDFQKKTVDYIFKRLSNVDCQRFLCADEVGLGKTIIAKGIIENYLKERNGNLKVFYICSSQFLANKNIEKLHPGNNMPSISRLTQLIVHPELINQSTGLSIIPLSPKTSVDLQSRSGVVRERAYLYRLIKESGLLAGRWESTFKRVLLGTKDWDNLIYQVMNEDFDEGISNAFINELKSRPDLIKELKGCFDERQSSLSIIGKLREILSTVSLKTLKPDIIILDEFQRFSEILKESESEDSSDLISALFKNDETEMLLLSATPYKMYTVREEEEQQQSHYEEFHFLLRFLMREDYLPFLDDWNNYSEAILSLRTYEPGEIELLKGKVEKWLYKYMCRTERNIVYDVDAGKSLIQSKYEELPFSVGDIKNFIDADRIVKCIEEKYPDIYSPLEYSKTVPFPLTFMDGYKLKTLYREIYKESTRMKRIVASSDAFLKLDEINKYNVCDFKNAKMNWLVKNNIQPGAQLLWIPPVLPYYKLNGPFCDKDDFSKIMIFGRFAVEPRAVATLGSYAAELYSTGSKEATKANSETKKREYYLPDGEAVDDDVDESVEEKKKYNRVPRRRLNFKPNDIPYSLFCFYYPSAFLSTLVASVLIVDVNIESNVVLEQLANEIKTKLNGIEKYTTAKGGKSDVRWYMFALFYLDANYARHEFNLLTGNLTREYILKVGLHQKLNKLADYIDLIRNKGLDALAIELNLGEVPGDLAEVLSTIALGSPATLAYTSFKKAVNEFESEIVIDSFNASLFIADGFRSYFNQPEAISVIDIFNEGRSDYWLSAMQYNIAGCLLAVLDESFYMYCDGHYSLVKETLNNKPNSKPIEKYVEFITGVLGIRTASLTVDMMDIDKKVIQKSMRTHYALAFMDQVENDGTLSRKGSVQDSFNSPFRPFILSTTSIGQEGLDFHKYCRQLLHWSLPQNAIDMEQREGRINRYKHFALRKNLVATYYSTLMGTKVNCCLWTKLFDTAASDHQLRGDNCQLVPFWHVPRVSVPLERIALTYPYSKDVQKLNHLLKTLTVYRMSLGQPNQEDLVRFLFDNFTQDELEAYKAKMMINLSPVAYEKKGISMAACADGPFAEPDEF